MEPPTFDADILPGDILLRFNESPIIYLDDFDNKLVEYSNRTVQAEIWRNGGKIQKEVKLNSPLFN